MNTATCRDRETIGESACNEMADQSDRTSESSAAPESIAPAAKRSPPSTVTKPPLAVVKERLANMNRQEFRALLVDAGITKSDGTPTGYYRDFEQELGDPLEGIAPRHHSGQHGREQLQWARREQLLRLLVDSWLSEADGLCVGVDRAHLSRQHAEAVLAVLDEVGGDDGG